MVWTIVIATFLAGGALGVFVTLVIGIHAEERRMSLKSDPQTTASASTRQILAHVRRPDDDITKFAI
ncbi:MAG TPA: hypothetical protein VFU43_10725 [Streptosporangiaceae bacterium]|nr:hypothetical protein [Streptosporangiaceae bacterium]